MAVELRREQVILRDYQSETVEKVFALYQENPHGRAKFVWATGLGKTVGFSAIAHKIREYNNTNVLIIAHRDELLSQAMEKYHFIDPTAVIGKIGGGVFEWGAPVTVASIQTICRDNHLKQLATWNYGVVIVDEMHHAHKDNEYGKVLAALPDAFKIGVTATDMRLDKRTNDDLFGEAICTFGIGWAIHNHHLCDIRAIAIKTSVTLDIKTSKNMDGETDFNLVELAGAIDTPGRNKRIVDAWKEHASGRRTICFGVTVEHAKHISEAFTEQGINAAYLHAKTSPDERKRLYKGLADGSLLVLCSVQVLTEGFDSPLVSCVIMARPTQSQCLFIQSIGRGLRLAPGKQDCIILDLTDNVFNHRLEPQSLSKVLKKHLKDNETFLEMEEREEKECAEREVQVHKLPATRDRDFIVNLLESYRWDARDNGMYVLTVGKEQHRIALIPEENEQYSVYARLFPAFEPEQWFPPQPIDWAMNAAERQIKMLLADPLKFRKAIDPNAEWRTRTEPNSEKQIKMLLWKKIEFMGPLTKVEASDLIEAFFAKKEIADAAAFKRKMNKNEGAAQKKTSLLHG